LVEELIESVEEAAFAVPGCEIGGESECFSRRRYAPRGKLLANAMQQNRSVARIAICYSLPNNSQI